MAYATRENMMTLNARALAAAVAAIYLMVPAVVSGQAMPGPEEMADQSDDSVEEEMDGEDEARPWSVSASMRMGVGQGTFVSLAEDSEHADEVQSGAGAYDRVSMSFAVSPSYTWNDFSFSGDVAYSQFLTAGGGSIEPYEGRFQDIGLSAGHSGYTHEGMGITIAPSFSASLPASARSRAMTTIVSTSLGTSISRNFFDSLTLGYRIGVSRNFHEYTSPVMDVDKIGEDNALFRVDGAESIEPGRMAVAGINTQWGMSHGVSASVMFSPQVMAMANYGLQTGWTYNVTEDDEFTSERQCVGRCSGQMSSGAVMLNYIVSPNLSFSGGISTQQSPKTADQKSYNFPFWNFSGGASNASSLTIGLSGSY